ncbi:MAG: diacylglycerol/lipid kinase family protein [Anaerolineae bacterium]
MHKIIVNPLAGKGRAGRIATEVKSLFTELKVPFDFIETRQAGEAILLAKNAADEEYDVLVAVGGDGTTQEVINGIMTSGKSASCKLAIIPEGSGNDFAAVNNIPMDLKEACRVAAGGQAHLVDIAHVRVNGDYERYFANTLGIGLDGIVGIETRKLPWLRGIPLYLLALLKTVFVSLKPFHIEMTVDGVTIKQRTLMVAVANGRREGGGFLIAPQAKQDDGYLDIIYTAVLSRFGVLKMIPLFLKGTHLGHPAIKNLQGKRITVTSPDPMYMHIDGEIYNGAASRVEIRVVPGQLLLITP